MPQAAILDVDGTLVDTNYQHALAWYRAFRAHEVVLPLYRIHRHIGMGGDQFVRALAGEETERELGDEIRAAEKDLYAELLPEVEPLEGAADLVRDLHGRGQAVVLASSAKGEEVDHYLDLLGIRDVVDGWTTSDDVEATKPEPDLVQAAMEKAGTGEAVMVGDSTWDCEAARRAGIDTVAVLTGGFSERELRDAGAAVCLRVDHRAPRRSRSHAARRLSPARRGIGNTQGMADRLERYRGKRDFRSTPEPAGDGKPPASAGRFVVQEHDASHLHWDLRLEREGTLASWALPRGVPEHPKENRLAVHTEDHPLEYLEFEGEIPKGEYGGGTMIVWDTGTYDAEKFRDDEVIAEFHGERMRGRYALIRTRGKDWLIHRMDPPEDPGYEPLPEKIAPMQARGGSLPRDESAFGFEVKWDGIRALAYCDHGHLNLQGRNFTDFTSRYPELRELPRRLGAQRMVLDGEVVALDEQGRPSFERLQSRMHLASDSAVRRRMRDLPVTYVIFDLLYLGGHSTMSLAYGERRALLEQLELEGPVLAHARLPPR